jgi:hypothetical protein
MPPFTHPRHSKTAEPKPGRKSWLLQKGCAGFKGERARIYEIFLHQTSRSISDSWFRASAMTAMNKKPTRCTIVLKQLKFYCILIPLYIFQALLRPSPGAS